MADPERKPTHTFAFEGEAFESLARMVQEFGSTLDVDQLLRDTACGLARHVEFDTFAVLLLDSLGRELHFRFGEQPLIECLQDQATRLTSLRQGNLLSGVAISFVRRGGIAGWHSI